MHQSVEFRIGVKTINITPLLEKKLEDLIGMID